MTQANPPEFPELSSAALSFWAKSGDGELWLSVAQHLRDSADVATELWQTWVPGQLRNWFAAEVGLDFEQSAALIAWLAGTHDIGKVWRDFAGQLDARNDVHSAALSQRIRDEGFVLDVPASHASQRVYHGVAGRAILAWWLTEKGLDRRSAVRLAAVADAHHGTPSSMTERQRVDAYFTNEYDSSWRAVWAELLDSLAAVTGVSSALDQLRANKRRLSAKAQMIATGVVVMTDWIASNELAFPMLANAERLPASRQRERVAAGLNAVAPLDAWQVSLPEPVDANRLIRARFKLPSSAVARPVQAAAIAAAEDLPAGGLILIEAPTGEGKTEAALLAAEVIAAQTKAGGVFIGAPTTATSDALLTRVLAWAQQASAKNSVASIHLAHSKAKFNPELQRIRIRGISAEGHGALIASAWFTGRKKGMFATFVVGTVDQLLVMVLASRHAMLRHASLAGKVVIIDEVHAYDAYMGVYLRMALEWLAEYGATVILLSATLPLAIKHDLLKSYALPLRAEVPDSLSSGYPLITSVDAEHGVREQPVTQRKDDRIELGVNWMSDELPELISQLESVLNDGGCALVICNSVGRAQTLFAALPQELATDAVLLHAGFIAGDRIRIEQQLVRELGPTAHRGAGRPFRRLVVATQVVEQSLDIDVDLLVTDIAPIDLICQRAGRLHRHARPSHDRPEQMRGPTMWIRGVLPSLGTPKFDGAAEAIYGRALLLSTLSVLQSRTAITRPDDVPSLVQEAYAEHPPLPHEWSDDWQQASEEMETHRQDQLRRASTFCMPSPADATELSAVFLDSVARHLDPDRAEEAGFAQVRDIEPTLEVVLARSVPGGYAPLPWLLPEGQTTALVPDAIPPADAARLLATSLVRLPRRVLNRGRRGFDEERWERTLTMLERSTPRGWSQDPLLRGQLGLILDDQLRVALNDMTLEYDPRLGLREVKTV